MTSRYRPRARVAKSRRKALSSSGVGPVLVDPLFIGFTLGYLAYDGTHYAIHHFRMNSRWGRWIKRHHMVHHHTGMDARWGVSSPLWDWVFGTMGTAKAEERA